MLDNMNKDNGNLNIEPDIHTENVLETLASGFNQPIYTDKSSADVTRINSDMAADTSGLSALAGDRTKQNEDNIVNKIDLITGGLQENAEITEEAPLNTEEITIDDVLVPNEAENVNKFNHIGSDTSTGNLLGLKELVQTIENVQKSSVLVYQVFEELKDRSGRINEINTLVTEISEQTNQLVLNTAKEAAKDSEGDSL
ncbi:hypothetical protein Ana3638_15105 [Anaerocolumna sedimenticola]|uniref:Methyl-accepting transducer domain-containing protein n=1 Tax=Anaerocolumna sedimenticola TaxID=2696063 RepID=A0A6P1TP17_9FIRM|nr:methyl-accepting chemotaxis protein [Anaerocolumna sedimenticola]QHQ61949.1 hypothetical protein Ana3638_15105 [Anaerocolumna sedimenticola]